MITASRGFFQGNLAVTGLLCDTVAGWVKELDPEVFFDLYAGVGTFTLLAAQGVPRAVCVEENLAALEALRMNAAERGLKNIRVIQGMAEKVFPAEWAKKSARSALVCLDPPRQGLERELAEFLGRTEEVSAILYISCDPATLARLT